MIDVNKLRGKFVEKGYDTQEKQANVIGMSTKTLQNKLKRGVFNSNEIFKIMEILKSDDPTPIFLSKIYPNRKQKKERRNMEVIEIKLNLKKGTNLKKLMKEIKINKGGVWKNIRLKYKEKMENL